MWKVWSTADNDCRLLITPAFGWCTARCSTGNELPSCRSYQRIFVFLLLICRINGFRNQDRQSHHFCQESGGRSMSRKEVSRWFSMADIELVNTLNSVQVLWHQRLRGMEGIWPALNTPTTTKVVFWQTQQIRSNHRNDGQLRQKLLGGNTRSFQFLSTPKWAIISSWTSKLLTRHEQLKHDGKITKTHDN